MPRKIQIRASYQADIGFFTRLAQAVERDTRLVSDEKREMMTALNNCALLFQQAERKRLSIEANDVSPDGA